MGISTLSPCHLVVADPGPPTVRLGSGPAHARVRATSMWIRKETWWHRLKMLELAIEALRPRVETIELGAGISYLLTPWKLLIEATSRYGLLLYHRCRMDLVICLSGTALIVVKAGSGWCSATALQEPGTSPCHLGGCAPYRCFSGMVQDFLVQGRTPNFLLLSQS